MKFPTRLSSVALFLAASFAGSVASAHVRLIDPPPRVDGEAGNTQLKRAPCGQMPNGRTEIVTDFTGGETITLTFEEYINHDSYYRVALDVEGDDSFPTRPEESVQQEGDDPASIHPVSDVTDTALDVYILQYYMDDLSPGFMMRQMYSTDVTLPNIDCQNCTLQVIQFMYDDPEPHYYQCADITITAAAGTDTTSSGAGGTSSAVTGTGPTGTGSTGIVNPSTTSSTTGIGTTSSTTGTTSSTTGTTSSTTTGFAGPTTTLGSTTSGTTAGVPAGTTMGTMGTMGSTGAPPVANNTADEEEGGCAFHAAPDASHGAWLGALLGLGILGYRRRPRTHC